MRADCVVVDAADGSDDYEREAASVDRSTGLYHCCEGFEDRLAVFEAAVGVVG